MKVGVSLEEPAPLSEGLWLQTRRDTRTTLLDVMKNKKTGIYGGWAMCVGLVTTKAGQTANDSFGRYS